MLNLENDYKNYNCNSLTIKNIGEKVYLQGWVKAKRDHGELVFIDLYDFYGMTQLTCENTNVNLINSIKNLPRESVIAIQGKVVKRSENSKNIKIITGEIEIAIESMEILNKSLRLPFELHESNTVNEEICFQYRFLQLRGGLNQIMYLRSNIVFQIRQFMHSKNFIEVETPILTGPSEEGARDFVVPSRLHKGKFYALPQAPQIFKQLTMVGGLPKYYQIAKCFRDEDLRRDRSLEFTQLDIEIAFATKDQIFAYIEELMQLVFKLPNKSFRRIQYNDAMNLYGTDKPDLRNPLILQDITDLLLTSGLNMFVNNIKDNKAVAKSIPAPKSATLSRSFFNDVMNYAVSKGAKGLAYIQKVDGKYLGPIAKRLSVELCDKIFDRNQLSEGDSIFFVCDNFDISCLVAGCVRNYLAEKLNLYTKGFEFCWIEDFPFFKLDSHSGKLDFNHNPFSKLHTNDWGDHLSQDELLKIKAYQFDIVCNGYELGSGALRNHSADMLYKLFEMVGYDQAYVDQKFNALLTGLKFGAPPHGGIALGVDRIIMLLSGKSSIREVVAFPVNQNGIDHLMKAPNTLDNDFLMDLGIVVNNNDKK